MDPDVGCTRTGGVCAGVASAAAATTSADNPDDDDARTAVLGDAFVLHMTSDSKVRRIVHDVATLASRTVEDPPEMDWFDEQFDPDDGDGPLLPFSVYLITGTAGAGKSTSIAALHQNINCLVTGATTVAAQNLSRGLRAFCPTVFNAFGFKSRHITIPLRTTMRRSAPQNDVRVIQYRELSRYWPIVRDISQDFTRKKQRGLYSTLSDCAFNTLSRMGSAQLWTTNVIIIDEAGTLSSYILTAVVFFYWFFNAWLQTPLYRRGAIPCIVCVGSPTQTDAYQSLFDHGRQRHRISECDNVLSFVLGTQAVSNYVNIGRNWALFINSKRCVDREFGHLLKTLEYGLEITDDIMRYVNRFVVPTAKILNPLEYPGWTRLFLSHAEVKNYLACLHVALGSTNGDYGQLFTCPVVCEVFVPALEEYKERVNLPGLTALEWLTKNLHRLSNYSQFVDQDMVVSSTEAGEASVKVTYVTTFVKNSYISLNGKTKKCLCGFMGSVRRFKDILDSDAFLDSHGHDDPEYVYAFLNTLMYNGLYNFHRYGMEAGNRELLNILACIPIPNVLITSKPQAANTVALTRRDFDASIDMFYHVASPPPAPGSVPLSDIVATYSALKTYFVARYTAAIGSLGPQFDTRPFHTFTVNLSVRDGTEFSTEANTARIYGLLDYASTVESYRLKGYTFAPVYFGRPAPHSALSFDLRSKMPTIMVQDVEGFVACLENNINKMTETLDDGTLLHLCSAGDYGISSRLAMTIVKAQGLSLSKVAVSFGNHRRIKRSHVYVAISRAVDPESLVIDRNPLCERGSSTGDAGAVNTSATKHIVGALHNPDTLLVY
uniref:Helicase subunit of helicase-primase complex n=1 Tax=Otarine gammaherpesvirus 4 TaxID=2801541 RepID=A0A889IW94_9GAMA|nr:Helicase subunit of helicase-primase complex [Otarine gammaherpesvirus 4]